MDMDTCDRVMDQVGEDKHQQLDYLDVLGNVSYNFYESLQLFQSNLFLKSKGCLLKLLTKYYKFGGNTPIYFIYNSKHRFSLPHRK